ncbi:hypothetical protein FKM82_011991 [Ascaphus truei]
MEYLTVSVVSSASALTFLALKERKKRFRFPFSIKWHVSLFPIDENNAAVQFAGCGNRRDVSTGGQQCSSSH